MKGFDRGHFPALFGDLYAISDQKKPTIDSKDIGEKLQDGLGPRTGKFVKFQTGAMKEIQDSIITGLLEPQGPNDAGNGSGPGAHGL